MRSRRRERGGRPDAAVVSSRDVRHSPAMVRLLASSALVAVLAGCRGCAAPQMECSCSSGLFARGEECRCTLEALGGGPYRHRSFSRFIKQSPDVKIEGTVAVKEGAVRVSFA